MSNYLKEMNLAGSLKEFLAWSCCLVTVNFEAIEPHKFEENITLEFSDNEGGLPLRR